MMAGQRSFLLLWLQRAGFQATVSQATVSVAQPALDSCFLQFQPALHSFFHLLF